MAKVTTAMAQMLEEVDYEVQSFNDMNTYADTLYEAEIFYTGSNECDYDLLTVEALHDGRFRVEVENYEFTCETLGALKIFLIQFSK